MYPHFVISEIAKWGVNKKSPDLPNGKPGKNCFIHYMFFVAILALT